MNNNRKEKKGIKIHKKDLESQNQKYFTANYNLSGGVYSNTNTDDSLTWNILRNKLALIGRLPYDCGCSSGDCFIASVGHSLYNNADLHFQIRSAGITHMINYPELYIESVANESWIHYIEEMSRQGTWCDHIIIQAVANALSCTIHITDSDPNADATIITPLNSHQKQRIVFLSYINDLHYVSTLQESSNKNAINNLNSLKRKLCLTENKRKEMLAKKRKLDKQRRANETSDTRKLRLKKHAEVDKKHRASEIDDAKQLRLAKKRQAYRSKISVLNKEKQTNIEEFNDLASSFLLNFKNVCNVTQDISKIVYLTEFDALKNGALHDQSWAKCNMKQFHKSMHFVIFQCTVCKEAWPINTKPKSPASYMCLRCSRDKNRPKKFSDANYMVPGPVPIELQDLTQTEEMLIARALPVMRVYIKPGGQRGYSGHCINLPQNVKELASVLPRYPKDLSIIVVKVKGKDNTFKDVNVRRQKVYNALLWLLQNNLHYKDVTIKQHALDCLPINGIPTGIITVESDSDIVSDEIASPDLGPSTDSDEDDEV